MKTKLLLLLAIAAFPFGQYLAVAADEETITSKVQHRLRELDISLALRQYEKVKMEAFETELKAELLHTETELTESERERKLKLLAKRLGLLENRAHALRQQIAELAAQHEQRTGAYTMEDQIRRQMEADRKAARAELQELRKRYKDKHPAVQRQMKIIAELEQQK